MTNYPPDALAKAVHAIRTRMSDEFAANALRALQRWPVTVSRAEIAGIPCQIITPADQQPAATLLHIFGGGYVSGSPESEQPITCAISAQSAIRIVVPYYALAPEHPFPAGLEECIRVYDTLSIQNGHQPFYLSGESAGGGMAMALTRRAIGQSRKVPDRLVLFSPWSDLTAEGIARSGGIDDPTITVEDLRVCVQAYLGNRDPGDPRVSPGLFDAIPAQWPPTLLTTGSQDILQHTVRRIAENLRAASRPVEIIDAEGMCHVFEIFDEFPEGTASLEQAAAFLTPGR